VQSYLNPTVYAVIALQNGNPQKAVEILDPVRSLDLSTGDFGNMEPAYIRGLAYLKLGDGDNAATEFQKVMDHPGIVQNFVIGALAHLQLARAYEMSGKHEEARTQYQDFLALWKDADPDTPVLKQAKAEYAKLKP